MHKARRLMGRTTVAETVLVRLLEMQKGVQFLTKALEDGNIADAKRLAGLLAFIVDQALATEKGKST
jgi:hypothetical protein